MCTPGRSHCQHYADGKHKQLRVTALEPLGAKSWTIYHLDCVRHCAVLFDRAASAEYSSTDRRCGRTGAPRLAGVGFCVVQSVANISFV